MPIELVEHPGPGEFLALARTWLERDETANNVVLGAAGLGRPTEGADWLAVLKERDVVGAVMRTPPHHPVLTTMPQEAVAAVADFYASRDISGVFAPSDVAREFLGCGPPDWRARAKPQAMTLLECRKAAPATNHPPGAIRPPHSGDEAVIAELLAAFADAVEGPHLTNPLEHATKLIAAGTGRVWDVDGGIVSLVNCGRQTAHGAVISAVYTPPDERGKGYASALVRAVTAEQFRSGKSFCCLYAAVDAPVPNHVYRKVGYEPQSEFDCWRFE